jgi:hypothetical protein
MSERVLVAHATKRFPFSRMPASDARDPEAIAAWARWIAPLAGGRPRADEAGAPR